MGESAEKKAKCATWRIVAGLALYGAACGAGAPQATNPGNGELAAAAGNGEVVAAPGSAEVVADDRGSSRIRLDRRAYAPGEPITVEFTAPPGLSSDAWVGLVPSMVAPVSSYIVAV